MWVIGDAGKEDSVSDHESSKGSSQGNLGQSPNIERNSDDGEGILSSNGHLVEQMKQANDFVGRDMDSTDQYLMQNNLGNFANYEEAEKKNSYPKLNKQKQSFRQPRSTYQFLLERVGFQKQHIQVDKAHKDFEEKKRALVGKKLVYTESEWEGILENSNRNKLFETSSKRIKESLRRGIPDNLRGRIWCFL